MDNINISYQNTNMEKKRNINITNTQEMKATKVTC